LFLGTIVENPVMEKAAHKCRFFGTEEIDRMNGIGGIPVRDRFANDKFVLLNECSFSYNSRHQPHRKILR